MAYIQANHYVSLHENFLKEKALPLEKVIPMAKFFNEYKSVL